ncbi:MULTISPECIES: hypothetical protein [unclassified Chelatococcus]|uniref:hypothetical protein n=1 Tax=unclassified Chelatococcus TaxID=2638111 RepID=UPI001BCB4345|nr:MULTISPECIES: hypothetical protein [unclassified Chelatococcus]MBS7699093.1 hypothetical protein [Chelatococcus sp. YT9]MBX3554874.1 hypothetical protein [Chelatococcus sp.]
MRQLPAMAGAFWGRFIDIGLSDACGHMATMKRSRYNGEPCFACLTDLHKPPGPPDVPAGMVKLRVAYGGLADGE